MHPDPIFDVLARALAAGHDRAYSGWSKFDGLRSTLTSALSFGQWPLRLAWSQLVMRSPVNLRPLLLVRPGVNPESPALFARANLDLAAARGADAECEARARFCLDWLLEHDSADKGDWSGRCWGYHHPWQSPGFYQPPGFPNSDITAICAGALTQGSDALGEARYLDAARDAADFFLRDLPVLHETAEEKCLAYVPRMRTKMGVININALAASLLARVATRTGEAALAAEARRLMAFVVGRQTDYGAWYYTTEPGKDLITHDNYHTGMILDALIEYREATGDERFDAALASGLDFYRERLFLPGGEPRWTSEKDRPWDAHGSGQGALTFALAGETNTARRIAEQGVALFHKGDGNFSYQRTRLLHKRFTLLHWCNGWMVRGLAALVRAEAAARGAA